MESVKRSRFTFEIGFSFIKMASIQQIRTNTERITELFEQISELKSYISQLTHGTMSRLGSAETNREAIEEYEIKITELEKEIQITWKTT